MWPLRVGLIFVMDQVWKHLALEKRCLADSQVFNDVRNEGHEGYVTPGSARTPRLQLQKKFLGLMGASIFALQMEGAGPLMTRLSFLMTLRWCGLAWLTLAN